MAARNFRRSLFNIHKWLGLNIALYFALIFLSGAVLVFSDEIEAIYKPNIWASQPSEGDPVTFGEIYDSLKKNFPGSSVFSIDKAPHPGLADRSYVTTAEGRRIIAYTDPGTAEIRDVTGTKNFHGFVRAFHSNLFITNRIGFVLVTSTSILLLVSLISGTLTYRRFWRGLFRFPPRGSSGREFWGVTHRLIAVWCLPFLVIVTVTTFYFFLTGVGFEGHEPEFSPIEGHTQTLPDDFGGLVIDQAEQVALATYPDLSPRSVSLPWNSTQGLGFRGPNGSSALTPSTSVSVDPFSLTIAGTILPSDFKGMAWLRPMAEALHYGHWWGNISRVLWSLFGLASTLLVVGGAALYASRMASQTEHGRVSTFWSGLALFRWAYLAMIAGVLALGAYWLTT
ncbi:MAG: PepSY-associated TM helix domain-containing protein [Marinosulfonomonas sp.]